MEYYCRLCAHIKPDMVPIFNGNDDESSISYRIHTNLHIPIAADDLLPSAVCNSCLEALDKYCEYVSNCQSVQNHLQKLLLTAETSGRIEFSKPVSSGCQDNNISSTRQLVVRIPKLRSDYFCKQAVIKEEPVDVETNISILPETLTTTSLAKVIEIKEEQEETVSSNILNANAALVDECEVEFEQLLTTSISCDPLAVHNWSDKKKNTKTSDDDDFENIIRDENNFDVNLTFVSRIPSRLMVLLNKQQLSDVFAGRQVDKMSLKKLGKEIFNKYIPKVVQDRELRLTYEDLLKLLPPSYANCESSRPVCYYDESKNEYPTRIEDYNSLNQSNDDKKVNEISNCTRQEDLNCGDQEVPSTKITTDEYASEKNIVLPKIKLKDIMKSTPSVSKITRNDKYFKCTICHSQFLQEPFLKEHLSLIHKMNPCSKCLYYTIDPKTLEQHIHEVHQSLSQEKLPSSSNVTSNPVGEHSRNKSSTHLQGKHLESFSLSCPLCSYKTARRYLLNQHHKEVHDKRFECDICGKLLGKKSKMVLHFQTHHSDRPPIKCSLCNETFSQRYHLKQHMKLHKIGTQWICTLCNEVFDQKYKLVLHNSKKHEIIEVKCGQCSFKTCHKYQLTQHVREVHEKRFRCDTCGKQESKKSRLLVHIRNKHSTKKVHTCKRCSMTFISKGWFEVHTMKCAAKLMQKA